MSFQVDRSPFDPESGFEYYICFKPPVEVEGDEVRSRISVEAALSISETGDVADLSFMLPKMCRNDHALSYLKRDPDRGLRREPRVYCAARPERRCRVQCSRDPRVGPCWTHRSHRNQRLHSQDQHLSPGSRLERSGDSS